MTLSRAMKTSLLVLLAGTAMVTEARFNQITVRGGGVTFRVRRFIADVANLYRLVLRESGVFSSFFIGSNGLTTFFKAGSETYNIAYDGETGSITEVTRTDNAVRALLADDLDQDIMHRRLQYACGDCEEAWDVVCDITLPIICQLVGNDVLGTVGAQAVDTTCTQFGDLCDSVSAAEACDGNCVEDGIPTPSPTTITALTPAPMQEETPPPTPAPLQEETLPPTPSPMQEETLPPTPSPMQEETPPPTPAPMQEETLPPTPSPMQEETLPPTPSPMQEETLPPTPAPMQEETLPPTPAPMQEETLPPTPAPMQEETPPPTPAPMQEEDACDPNPCENDGVCNVDPAGGHICDCASGFGGMSCQTDTSTLDDFFIEIEYDGEWTSEQEAVLQSAADRWSEVITDVPCGGSANFPAGRLLITATLISIDGPGGFLGNAGPTGVWQGCPTISATGNMIFDIDDIDDTASGAGFDDLVLHEMGHVIGVGTLWGDCSTCRDDGNADWQCPAIIEVYNDLLGDPDGTEASVIETDGGSNSACFNFDETTFGNELMTTFITIDMPLSKITAASLEDTGYTVDPSAVDDYSLPTSTTDAADVGLFLTEVGVDTIISVLGDDGEVVEEMDGVTLFFS